MNVPRVHWELLKSNPCICQIPRHWIINILLCYFDHLLVIRLSFAEFDDKVYLSPYKLKDSCKLCDILVYLKLYSYICKNIIFQYTFVYHNLYCAYMPVCKMTTKHNYTTTLFSTCQRIEKWFPCDDATICHLRATTDRVAASASVLVRSPRLSYPWAQL